jgi:hypothetical protein
VIPEDKAADIGRAAGRRPRRLAAAREYGVQDEVVLYVPGREETFSLNAPARAIWELCSGVLTLAEISAALGDRFGCSGEDLLPDVVEGVTRLHELGLLEEEPVAGLHGASGG